jgi:hypothetical protein
VESCALLVCVCAQIVLSRPEAAVYLMGCGMQAASAEDAASALPGESCALLSDLAMSKLSIADYMAGLRDRTLTRYVRLVSTE